MKIKLWLSLLVFITACGPLSPASVIPSITNLPTFTSDDPALSPTYTLVAFPTLDPSSYQTPTIPPIHVWLTQDALATPIRTPVTPIPVWLPRVYENDGNLYFQKNEDLLIQLTYSGKDRDPILSHDEQKIVFYRGEVYDNVYSINADGSEEKLIIKSSQLPVLGQGEIKALTFAPNSHYLRFNTYLCNPRTVGPSYNAPDCTVGIYGVNTDSGEIREIISGLSGNMMQDRNFQVSPNGKYISVAASGLINIYAGSDVIYQNALIYDITRSDEYLPEQYWLPDSSGLIAVVATSGYNNYAVYRYILGDKAIEIVLGTSIGRGDLCISPDRDWIYFSSYLGGENYLANLKSGYTQPYQGGSPFYCKWSPDSKHFASTSSTFGVMGSVEGPPQPVGG
jgi:Tol biopolymer transport system component